MLEDKKLTELFEKTDRLPFNDHSKFIFFGDVHRGDNSISDEFSHNQNIYYYALAYYFSRGYTYIETGDGDELWEQPRYNVIIDAYSNIFNLLKNFHDENRFIMLYGNHNIQLRKQKYADKYLKHYHDDYLDQDEPLFSNLTPVESIVLKHEETGQEFFVVHGHQGDILNHSLWRISFILIRFFWRFLHLIGFNYAASPAKNKTKRRRVENEYGKWAEKHKTPIICGHTHRPRFPRGNDSAYFNTGCCIHPQGITGIEIESGKIRLVEWGVRPDGEGFLYIRRRIIHVAEPLSYFKTGVRVPTDDHGTQTI